MGTQDVVDAVLKTAAKLKGSTSGNEANTKALLIEPMLQSLGWDLGDLDVVEREVKVFDGTYLDYALKVSGASGVYVEAKGISQDLMDKKFIAQTINYANNDGVIWCVLTNGLRYRGFKTNEPMSMDQKLLFEVDLADGKPASEKIRLLRLIGREAVQAGELNAFGDRVFTDTRVRRALSTLATDPPSALIKLVMASIGHPAVSPDALRRSLARILDANPVQRGAPASSDSASATKPVGPSGPPKGPEYDLEHHLGNKSTLIRELWEAVDDYAQSLGADVSRRVRKQYIGYFRGKKSFFTAEIQKGRILIYLSLTADAAQPWDEKVMRDVSKIGHFGMGSTEFSLVNVDQLTSVQALIARAYKL